MHWKTSRVHSYCCSDTCIIRYIIATLGVTRRWYTPIFNGDVTPIPILSFQLHTIKKNPPTEPGLCPCHDLQQPRGVDPCHKYDHQQRWDGDQVARVQKTSMESPEILTRGCSSPGRKSREKYLLTQARGVHVHRGQLLAFSSTRATLSTPFFQRIKLLSVNSICSVYQKRARNSQCSYSCNRRHATQARFQLRSNPFGPVRATGQTQLRSQFPVCRMKNSPQGWYGLLHSMHTIIIPSDHDTLHNCIYNVEYQRTCKIIMQDTV